MSDKKTIMKRVFKVLGGQVVLAAELGVTQQTVSYWVTKKGCFPVERVLHIESLLRDAGEEIDRFDLRPDIYGPRPVGAFHSDQRASA